MLALAAVAAAPGARPARAQEAPAPVTAIEALVIDRDGRLVENLGPSDFTVTVDGRSRPVLWVKRVSRGPGALADAASRQVGAAAGVRYASEARRNVLLVIDEATLVRGDERAVIRAADAFLERLGIDDLIAVVRLPTSAGSLLTLTTERPPVREALATVAGRAAPAGAQAPVLSDLEAMADPNVKPDVDRLPDLNKPPAAPGRAGADDARQDAAEVDQAGARGTLPALNALMASLQGLTGRKVVLLFSAGLVGASPAAVENAAAAAVAARATVYAFGLRAETGGSRRAPDVAPIQAIARATGGTFAMLGRNPGRTLERAVAELSATYVLGIEAEPADAGDIRRVLRVQTTLKGAAARSAFWLPSGPAPNDEVPPPQEFATEAPAAGAPAHEGGAPPGAPAPRPPASRPPAAGAAHPSSAPPPRDTELRLALARLFEYADAYERQYSMLVAEEEYLQSHRGGRTLTRADLLLVRPANRWVSFRDVFEVDGRPVRDREERLQRLFLDPTPEAQARLQSVMDESAKHNIGPVVRSINVPLFPLDILKSWNRSRFDFRLGQDADVDGLRAWRIHYVERGHPTLVEGLEGEDVPIKGRFLVDQLTGAILETSVDLAKDTVTGEIVVRYGRDQALGLWVPTEMRETYFQGGRRILMEGRADYSRFRRFQVKTEESVTLPVK